jgi:hypothetical protein
MTRFLLYQFFVWVNLGVLRCGGDRYIQDQSCPRLRWRYMLSSNIAFFDGVVRIVVANNLCLIMDC